jgi:hypothetical protein
VNEKRVGQGPPGRDLGDSILEEALTAGVMGCGGTDRSAFMELSTIAGRGDTGLRSIRQSNLSDSRCSHSAVSPVSSLAGLERSTAVRGC